MSTPKQQTQTKGKPMNDKFDELAKGLAGSTTRRQVLKRFGIGLTGMALACLGLANRAKADAGNCKPSGANCQHDSHCCSGYCQHIGGGKYGGGNKGVCF